MRTHTTRLIVACATAVWLVPAAAHAQRRMPHQGANAFGAEVGVFPPQQDDMTNGLVIAGFLDHYLTARDSVRPMVEWANPRLERNTTGSVRQVRLGADLVHNWEGGAVHPFVGAGLGAYFLQPRDNGHDSGGSATKLGGTILGGAEFFTSKTFSVKGEVRYNIVQKSGGYDPSGASLTIGAKTYF